MKRSSNQIKIDILKICRTPQRITHIMYKTNTYYNRLKKDLTELIKKGMLTKTQNSKAIFYSTTRKGKDVIKEFEEFIDLM